MQSLNELSESIAYRVNFLQQLQACDFFRQAGGIWCNFQQVFQEMELGIDDSRIKEAVKATVAERSSQARDSMVSTKTSASNDLVTSKNVLLL